MKLAEALISRATYQKRIAELENRLYQNALVQEGDTPAENPDTLLNELEQVYVRLTQLIRQINHTNSATSFDGTRTLTDVLAERDSLQKRHQTYRTLAGKAIVKNTRYSRSEVRFVRAVDVESIQARADTLAREARELDTRIQEKNWLTELVESK